MIDDSAVIRRRGANQSHLAVFFLLCNIRIPPHRASIGFFFFPSSFYQLFYVLEKFAFALSFFFFLC